MSDWPRVKISDVCELIVDCVNKTAPRVDYETPYKMIRTPNIKNGRVDRTDCRFVEEEIFEKWTKRAKVLRGDVLLTREAPMGQVGYVDFDDTVFLGQRIMQYRANPELLDSEYLLYAFLSADLQHQFHMHEGSGSVVSHIRVPDCSKFELYLPPLDEQKRIAKILRDLDKKIELNRQTNQTLEQIAQAIFKSWFVDFEPTRAKAQVRASVAQGRMPWSDQDLPADFTKEDEDQLAERAAMAAISGKTLEEINQLAQACEGKDAGSDTASGTNAEGALATYKQLKATAALFPDALVDSELGEIPEGWISGCVGDVASAKGGYAFKGKLFTEEGHPVVKIKNITGDGRVDLSGAVCIDDETAKSSNRFKLEDGDLLMAMTGATVGKIGFVVSEGKSIYLNQRVAKFESEEFGRKIAWFLFCCFERESIFDSVVGAAQGSAQPNISSSGIESTRLILPTDQLIHLFCEKANPLFNKWLTNISENSILKANRDLLLPRLLSGEFEMNEIE